MRESQPHTVGERLTRIETLLEGIIARLDQMERHTAKVETAQVATDRDYQRMKNRGAGILLAVSVVAGAIGANFDKLIMKIAN
jgi:hypothetical protein